MTYILQGVIWLPVSIALLRFVDMYKSGLSHRASFTKNLEEGKLNLPDEQEDEDVVKERRRVEKYNQAKNRTSADPADKLDADEPEVNIT